MHVVVPSIGKRGPIFAEAAFPREVSSRIADIETLHQPYSRILYMMWPKKNDIFSRMGFSEELLNANANLAKWRYKRLRTYSHRFNKFKGQNEDWKNSFGEQLGVNHIFRDGSVWTVLVIESVLRALSLALTVDRWLICGLRQTVWNSRVKLQYFLRIQEADVSREEKYSVEIWRVSAYLPPERIRTMITFQHSKNEHNQNSNILKGTHQTYNTTEY